MSPARLRDMLADAANTGITPATPVDQQFLPDSLALTWVLYVLTEKCGLDPDPEDYRLCGPTTIEHIADYVNELNGDG